MKRQDRQAGPTRPAGTPPTMFGHRPQRAKPSFSDNKFAYDAASNRRASPSRSSLLGSRTSRSCNRGSPPDGRTRSHRTCLAHPLRRWCPRLSPPGIHGTDTCARGRARATACVATATVRAGPRDRRRLLRTSNQQQHKGSPTHHGGAVVSPPAVPLEPAAMLHPCLLRQRTCGRQSTPAGGNVEAYTAPLRAVYGMQSPGPALAFRHVVSKNSL
jgi:hypothetical protein